MEYKTSPAPVSVAGGGLSTAAGKIRGLASTYGGPADLVGDIVERGAYTKTLRDRGSKRILLWKHDDGEPIGEATLTDTARGLELDGQLDMELPAARKAFYMASKGYGSLSIGYTATKKRQAAGGVRHLEEIDLAEVSCVLYPANPAARIEGAKASEWTLEELTADIRAYAAKCRRETHAREMARLDARTKQLAELAARIAGKDDAQVIRDRIAALEQAIVTQLAELTAAAKDPATVDRVGRLHTTLGLLRGYRGELEQQLERLERLAQVRTERRAA